MTIASARGASASRTFSGITDVIAEVQREVDRFLVAIGVHASSTSSSLPADTVVECSYVLAIKESPPYLETANLVAQRYSSESASSPGCLCNDRSNFCPYFL